MSVARHLMQAMKFYGCMSLAGAIGVFVVVEGWRLAAFFWMWVTASNHSELFVGLVYAACALIITIHPREWGSHRIGVLYSVMAATYVLLGTGGLYGFLTSVAALFPALRQFDIFSMTLITMSVLLLATMLLHRRTRS